MLTLDRSETTSALNYTNLNTSIQDTLAAIDRFEWQAIEELAVMRDNRYYMDAGYTSFESYCEKELTRYGGYRRVRDLLAASKVVDTLPESLREKITKPSQTRPLLRLVRTPDKLQEVVIIASKEKAFPTAADFAKAVSELVPKTSNSNSANITTKPEKPKTQLCQTVKVSSQFHPRYGEEGVIEVDAPNTLQQIVTFADGERLLVNNADLTDENDTIASFSTQRRYPKEYTEVIAELKEQHRRELERLEQELRIGLQAEANARAEAQIREQLESSQKLYQQQKSENIKLQQRLDEMQGLRQLELENQRLQQRIEELENAVEERPTQQWGNTMTTQVTKALNKQVKLALEKTIDLRSLAIEPPKENAQECLRLIGMALKQIASAMNNTQALEAAAIILGSSPTPEAIAYRAEQLEMLPQSVSDIRRVLAQPGCTWQDYWTVAQEYEVIKADYWAELTTQETELITALQKASSQPDTISIGSIVAHADPYRTLYVERGEVVEDLGEEVVVSWDHWKEQSKKTDRYFRDELRFWQPQ
ncbi:ATPase involved in DNA repair [Nostoc flagelliforme CCNUN1]|uniref:ATPase involved in DNA repair n=1 Tax=Nostoc flagelliforme CCNUN1 TaxID=2038116 RepID=A0A2K8T3A7_9NOSO|nr:hypothetical protein [Nostoc flagelliforme]AUB42139.1 ATPase involved in DNA repair [Nostoc flagelliforme CCNUN1]